MPEYLAPGVYVEETSFRARSIEGAGTSTTGFVGPTRKGPVSIRDREETPEILTSYGDFERIFGGVDPLDLGSADPARAVNYLAHAVLNYFNEGGARLYVSRVFLPRSAQDDGIARSPNVVEGATAAERARFVARFPGAAGNGRITLRELATPATRTSMDRAPDGSLLRAGRVSEDAPAAGPARLAGNAQPPFRVPAGGVLSFNVDGIPPVSITFGAESVRDLNRVTADEIDNLLVRGNVPVRAALAPSTGRLVFTSTATGTGASLGVRDVPNSVHTALGLRPAAAVGRDATRARQAGGPTPLAVPDGSVLALTVGATEGQITFTAANIADLDDVTVAEINTLLAAVPLAVTAAIEDGRLVLATNAAGATATLTVRDVPNSAHDELGLTAGVTRRGTDAQPARLLGAMRPLAVAAGSRLRLTVNGANPDREIIFTPDAVDDLNAVTVEEINALFTPAAGVTAAFEGERLVLRTTDTGDDASLIVRDTGANSAHAALGLTVRVPGRAGTAVRYYVKRDGSWVDRAGDPLDIGGLAPGDAPEGGAALVTLAVTVEDGDGHAATYDDLGFGRDHPRAVTHVLAARPARRIDYLENLFALDAGEGVDAFELHGGLFATGDERVVTLIGGNDGTEPNAEAYRLPLAELEKLEEVAIVAGPGSSVSGDHQAIQGALIAHAERRRGYRIAVLDTRPGLAISEARAARGLMDSTHAALYYPWVVVSNPLARPGVENVPREIALPPSGFVCGIYARNDVERGVFKAPANEVVRGALRFETDVNFAQQEVLNPIGVNCLRYLPGRGFRVWGARTASSDPEWKYVNIRRYFNYLEASIDRGTQWAVFEPNGERLWANIRTTISDFLYNEWVSGALLGSRPEQAFFVRCDRSTMTQANLDNGQLICLIGVAVIKPAEFVIFRIGQKTADARS